MGAMRRAASSFFHAHVGEPDMADFSRAPGIRENSHRVGERHFWVGGVKLVEIDALELEAL